LKARRGTRDHQRVVERSELIERRDGTRQSRWRVSVTGSILSSTKTDVKVRRGDAARRLVEQSDR